MFICLFVYLFCGGRQEPWVVLSIEVVHIGEWVTTSGFKDKMFSLCFFCSVCLFCSLNSIRKWNLFFSVCLTLLNTIPSRSMHVADQVQQQPEPCLGPPCLSHHNPEMAATSRGQAVNTGWPPLVVNLGLLSKRYMAQLKYWHF